MACDKAPLVDGNAILDSVMQVSIWAWSENEPPAAPLYPVPGSTCAVMLPENGRWLPEPCSGSYRVACMSTSNNKNVCF